MTILKKREDSVGFSEKERDSERGGKESDRETVKEWERETGKESERETVKEWERETVKEERKKVRERETDNILLKGGGRGREWLCVWERKKKSER